MFDVDRTLKMFADRYATEYIRWLRGPAAQPLEKLKVELPAGTRYADLVYRLREEGTEQHYIFHLEFQAQRSKEPMGLRMLDYDSRLLIVHKLPVCSTVVYLMPEADAGDRGELRVRCPGGEEVLVYRYDVRRLWEIQRDELVGSVGLYPLLGLTRLEGTEEEALQAIVREINCIREPDLRADALFGFKTLSALIHPKELLDRLVRKETLMESPVLQEIYQEALVEGRVEGRVEGQIEGRRSTLLDVLLTRFGLSHRAVRRLERRIGQIESLAVLQRLTVEALRVETVDEFEQVLDRLGVETVSF